MKVESIFKKKIDAQELLKFVVARQMELDYDYKRVRIKSIIVSPEAHREILSNRYSLSNIEYGSFFGYKLIASNKLKYDEIELGVDL